MSEKETFWLGIDCGGTYLKAGLYDGIAQRFILLIEKEQAFALSSSTRSPARHCGPGIRHHCCAG